MTRRERDVTYPTECLGQGLDSEPQIILSRREPGAQVGHARERLPMNISQRCVSTCSGIMTNFCIMTKWNYYSSKSFLQVLRNSADPFNVSIRKRSSWRLIRVSRKRSSVDRSCKWRRKRFQGWRHYSLPTHKIICADSLTTENLLNTECVHIYK